MTGFTHARRIAGALVAGGLLAGTAGAYAAQPAQPTPAQSGQAEAAQAALFLSGSIASQPTPADSGKAEAAQAASYLSGALPPAVTPRVIIVRPGGFDWGDAAIGAGFAGGLGLLAAGAAMATRRLRVPAHLAR